MLSTIFSKTNTQNLQMYESNEVKEEEEEEEEGREATREIKINNISYSIVRKKIKYS